MRHLALLALSACHPAEPGRPDGTAEELPDDPPPSETSLTGPALPPGDPGEGDIAVAVDTTAERHPISPWIYGDNGADFETWGANLTLARAGGNRFTAYNWENNASNAGTDWYNQNDGFLGGGDVPGEAIRPGIQAARDHGAGTIVTVPIQGFVAADKDEDGDVAQTPNYLAVRFHPSFPTKGAAFDYPPDGGDDAVYQDEFAAWLLGEFPGSETPLLFDLDNEPDLWSETHPRIHPDPVRYDELIDDTIAYAAAIKAVDPTATVLGPVSYGWNGYTTLQNAPDGDGRDFVEFYLDELAAADAAEGQRLVDALDLHWYPEALGGGTRITDDGAWAELAAARLQAPRSLWDDTYTEDSWITQWSTYGPIALIPRMQDKIAAFYPDTALSFSEYYYGGGDDVSGGLAEADVLGIFAHFGVFAATLWHTGSTDDRFIHGAYDLFRDYDGAGGRYGSTSVQSSTSDVAATSAWASAEGDRVLVLLINKTEAPLSAAVQVAHPVVLGTATPYVLDTDPAPRAEAAIPLPVQNALLYEMPPLSATMLVFSP